MERPDILKLIEGLQSRPAEHIARAEDVHPAYVIGPFLQTMNDLTGYIIYFAFAVAVAIALMNSLGIN